MREAFESGVFAGAAERSAVKAREIATSLMD
jgi:hypothetical protein